MQGWARGRFKFHLKSVSQNMGQGGFAKTGRPAQQNVVHGLTAFLGRLSEYCELLLHLILTRKFSETLRSQAHLKIDVLTALFAADKAILIVIVFVIVMRLLYFHIHIHTSISTSVTCLSEPTSPDANPLPDRFPRPF